MSIKIAIVNAFGRSNRGDSVLLDECIAEIRTAFPDAEIYGAVFEGIENAAARHPDIHWSERIGNSSRPGLFGKLHTLVLLGLAWAASMVGFIGVDRLLPAQQRATFKAVREAQIVVSAPGGYIHDTNLAYFVALFHIWLAVSFRRMTVLAPQSIGPIRRRLSKSIARRVLGRVDAICARESYTQHFLTDELSLPHKLVRRTGDSAFWNFEVLEDNEPARRQLEALGVPHGSKIFGITVVGWTFPGMENPGRLKDIYISTVAEIADKISETYGLTPVIFNQVSEDLPTALEVQAAATHPIFVDTSSEEPEALRAKIALSEVFLGSRFHSCIFSLMAGRPTFAIAYLPKTSFILTDLKLFDRYTSINEIDKGRILDQLQKDLADPLSAVQEITSAVEVYRQSHARLGEVLTELSHAER